eukprot:TRINITY_DN1286_c0_g1_i1.p1 TRINITY_DN1286_c0_g1~~TRINITY_DN1286_c0_g1_i1.p1  ORF type:complete len:354 (-),score=36.83 TRINITY_DN1286_c0_g1_i1:204-1265(-)
MPKVLDFYNKNSKKLRLGKNIDSARSEIAKNFGERPEKIRIYQQGLLIMTGHKFDPKMDCVFIRVPETKKTAPFSGDLDELFSLFQSEGRLNEKDANSILSNSAKLFKKEPNLIEIASSEAVVIGDLHGQWFDLANVFAAAGGIRRLEGENAHFIFLGDLCDRGLFSTEITLFICALKVKYPKNVFLVRGNHESLGQTKKTKMGTKVEFLEKYSEKCYERAVEMFNSLPLAVKLTCFGHSFLCCHGGIGKGLDKVSYINTRIPTRAIEPTRDPLMRALTWNDPAREAMGGSGTTVWPLSPANPSREKNIAAKKRNLKSDMFLPSKRGKKIRQYTMRAMHTFLHHNGLTCVFLP